jgi:hypothetical protein
MYLNLAVVVFLNLLGSCSTEPDILSHDMDWQRRYCQISFIYVKDNSIILGTGNYSLSGD